MKTRIWERYEGSVIDSVYEVIEVLKTLSPKRELGLPNALPVKDCPVLR